MSATNTSGKRQIKASEVKPGMTIQWTQGDMVIQVPVGRIGKFGDNHSLRTPQGKAAILPYGTPVTVLAEPQPEEPTAFGEKVVVAGERALCIAQGLWLTDGLERCTWDELCEMGPVQVIPDQGWTVPEQATETPEVPERIDEWPEDDTALRPYKWMNEYGEIWRHGRNSHVEGWTSGYLLQNRPVYGPWDRVTDE